MPKRKAAAKAGDEKPRLVIRYTLDDRAPIDLDVNKLTLRERIEVEEHFGMPWGQVVSSGWIFSEKAHALLAWIALRSRSSTLTYEDVEGGSSLTAEINPADDAGKDETPETTGSQSS
jgi:hypothetical protein